MKQWGSDMGSLGGLAAGSGAGAARWRNAALFTTPTQGFELVVLAAEVRTMSRTLGMRDGRHGVPRRRS